MICKARANFELARTADMKRQKILVFLRVAFLQIDEADGTGRLC